MSKQMSKIKVYVDMDGVLCDYDKDYSAYKAMGREYPKATPGFFKELDPIPGAIEGMNALARVHDVFILTRPSVKNNHCWSEKAAWVATHLGDEWLEKLIIACRKDLLCDGTSILIDDVLHSDAGQQVFDDANRLLWFGPSMTWAKVQFILGVD